MTAVSGSDHTGRLCPALLDVCHRLEWVNWANLHPSLRSIPHGRARFLHPDWLARMQHSECGRDAGRSAICLKL